MYFHQGFGRDSSPERNLCHSILNLHFHTVALFLVVNCVPCPEPCTPRWRFRAHLPGLSLNSQPCREQRPRRGVGGQDVSVNILFPAPSPISLQRRAAQSPLALPNGVIWKRRYSGKHRDIAEVKEPGVFSAKRHPSVAAKDGLSHTGGQDGLEQARLFVKSFTAVRFCGEVLNFRHTGLPPARRQQRPNGRGRLRPSPRRRSSRLGSARAGCARLGSGRCPRRLAALPLSRAVVAVGTSPLAQRQPYSGVTVPCG